MLFHDRAYEEVERYSIREGGRRLRVAPHFVLAEFASPDSDTVLIHPLLLALLEVIRAHFEGKPLIVNSGFRSYEHNQRVGGSKGSKHLFGLAADVRIPGIAPDRVAAYADHELQVGGVGRYEGHSHLDVFGRNRRWNG